MGYELDNLDVGHWTQTTVEDRTIEYAPATRDFPLGGFVFCGFVYKLGGVFRGFIAGTEDALFTHIKLYLSHLPKAFGIAPCECGNDEIEWSKNYKQLWCGRCQRHFTPIHWGHIEDFCSARKPFPALGSPQRPPGVIFRSALAFKRAVVKVTKRHLYSVVLYDKQNPRPPNDGVSDEDLASGAVHIAARTMWVKAGSNELHTAMVALHELGHVFHHNDLLERMLQRFYHQECGTVEEWTEETENETDRLGFLICEQIFPRGCSYLRATHIVNRKVLSGISDRDRELASEIANDLISARG